MKVLLLALTLALASCAAAPTYYHPTKTPAEFERDKYDCEQDGWKHASDVGFRGNPLIAADAMRDCMIRKHGYTIGPPQQSGDKSMQSPPQTDQPKTDHYEPYIYPDKSSKPDPK